MPEGDVRRPAHDLWVEIVTRTSRPPRLHDEECQLASIVAIFEITRKLMRDNHAEREFLCIAAAVLDAIRPFATRWHAYLDPNGRLDDSSQPRFCAEIEQLRLELSEFAQHLKLLAVSGCG